MVIWCVFLQVLRGDEKQDAQEEKLGDNFFSLFSSSSSKYGQRLSILQKKKELTKKFLAVESDLEKICCHLRYLAPT